jgi:hypothetical protein
MAFVTNGLPNGGRTAHFGVQYDDSLAPANGRDLAKELLLWVEEDYQLIQSWFPGVTSQFTLPIWVQITGGTDGAEWLDPPDIALSFYAITVTLMPGPHPTSFLLRYLLVSEVTEMFMASQRKDWYGPTGVFWGADERSMGESLSRFLASEFIALYSGTRIPSGFAVVPDWLNTGTRGDWVTSAPDDNRPDEVTGCGTCFLFFLRYQLGFSIQEIVAAAASNLAGVYLNLTGQTDAWTSFKALVDGHYPYDPSAKGPKGYSPPLDNVFPVADLSVVDAPPELTWVENHEPHQLRVDLTQAIPVDVTVSLSSNAPGVIEVPANVRTMHRVNVPFTVHSQSGSFQEKLVTLTASYAGQQKSTTVRVVRPENLQVPALVIAQDPADDPCTTHFVEGSSVSFVVNNVNVIDDRHGLTYDWTVTGGLALHSTGAKLILPQLPAAGSEVSIKVVAKAASQIHAEGTFGFTTQAEQTGLIAGVRALDCWLREQKEINAYIPPWVPIEDGRIVIDRERLTNARGQAERAAASARRAVAAVKQIEAHLKADKAEQAGSVIQGFSLEQIMADATGAAANESGS